MCTSIARTTSLIIAVIIVMAVIVVGVMGQETPPTATPTSVSDVTNVPILTATPTSQSAGSDEVITPPTPTSQSNVTDNTIATVTPTSLSGNQNQTIPTPTTESTTATVPELTETVIQNGDETNVTPFPDDWIDYQTSAFNPRGESAIQIRNLMLIIITMGALVYLYVVTSLFHTLIRRNDDAELDDEREKRGISFVVANGIVLTPTILIIVFILTLFFMVNTPLDVSNTDIEIDVSGERWWWDIEYPQYDFNTANELHIPVGQPVEITLLSDNVIHSFWVPELSFKVDLIPGRENTLRLEATEVGVYRGRCAEFCGEQHANMQFLVIVQSQADFEAWVNQQQQPAPEPVDDITAQGQDIFFDTGCSTCHTINGINATGEIGPDLTHLASRRTIAAGMLPNTRGHLAGWVVASQDIKPGSLMPDQDISGNDLQALLAYLQSLQ